ncbi:hypothetical protein BP6252_14109 [Coleophoma cylindrospora]|uniref:Uncharacterized protein n=1 Tax=Coleophoma cylindrospora TaxID=1849047 RepID=A0A3D8Q4I5_9HELO|nr:hypothetical protein BP6252_14109 [Coleophoma cylindrospora]
MTPYGNHAHSMEEMRNWSMIVGVAELRPTNVPKAKVLLVASNAFSSLSIFNQDAADFRDLLIQMALSSSTASSQAVLFALLAVASQYRDGLQSRAVQLKTAAISALAKSVANGISSTTEAAQHVAAGMLLCTFESQTCSATSGQWIWYIRGVKDVIKTNHLEKQTNNSFVTQLLDWVNYHEVIAQFSILHWRHGPVDSVFAKQLGIKGWEWILGPKEPQMSNRAYPPHRILQFLSEIFNILFQAFGQKGTTENLVESLRKLEGRASTIMKLSEGHVESSSEANTNAADMIELYQMVAMIYLGRASESISGEPRNVQPFLDRAFALLQRMRTCELRFPLLMLGFEARTDEQRIMILDLIRRAEENPYRRNLDCLRRSLRALWIQEDLVSDLEFVPKYMDRLNAIMSQARYIPSLV